VARGDNGAIVTDEAAVTMTVAVALRPSLVAVMVAEPGATPVTRPLAETVATPASELVQVIVLPRREAPLADCGVAVSWVLEPTNTVAVEGVTLTEATGAGVTVTGAIAVLPSTTA
jgi:hypothetical protein